MLRTLACLSALVVAIAGAPRPAAAQTEKGNVAVGYGYLHDPDVDLPLGWVAAVTGNVTPLVGIVGEVGGHYKSNAFDEDVSLRVHSFAGGVKVQGPVSARIVPFAQLLVGEAIFGVSALGESDSNNAFFVQPGGGVDIRLTPNAGIRVQGDFRNHHADGQSFNQFRIAAGAVFSFGRK